LTQPRSGVVLLIAGVASFCVAVAIGVAITAVGEVGGDVRGIARTIPSMRETRDSVLQVVALESALRGYLATGDKSFIQETDEARTRLDEYLTALMIYSNNHEIFKRWVAEAEPQLRAIEALLDNELKAAQHGQRAEAVAGLIPLKKLVDQYRSVGPYIDDGSIGTPALINSQIDVVVGAVQRARLPLTLATVVAVVVGFLCLGAQLTASRRGRPAA
jgi:CHASE3 domain sensor protein